MSLYLESNPLEKYDWAEEKKSPSKFYFQRSNVVDEIDEIDYEGIENIILDNLNQVLNNSTMLNKYTRSMMITLKLVLQSGYGTETSDSIYNMMMTIVVMFVGWIYATYVLIVVSNVMMASANSENKFEEMSMELDAFCAAKRLSPTLTTKIKTFFKYKFEMAYFNENAIRQSTPANLSKEIMMHTCSNLVAKVQLFKEIPQLLLENIISCLKIEIYFPGDVIISAGATGDAMFFIAFGTARIYSTSGEHFTSFLTFVFLSSHCRAFLTGKVLGTIADGSHFGEISLLIKGKKRIASVVALEMCECYKLSQQDFRRVIEPHARILHSLEQIALERIKFVINHNKSESKNV